VVAVRAILITGVSRPLGARFARSIADRDELEVVGIDVVPPKFDIGRARYVRADIRNAAIGRLISGSHVETVVHLGMTASADGSGGRSMMKEINALLLGEHRRRDSTVKVMKTRVNKLRKMKRKNFQQVNQIV